MESHHINKILCGKCSKIPLIMYNRIIYRDSPYHCGTFGSELVSEGLRVSMRAKVHDSLRSHIYSAHDLLHFDIVVSAVP